MSNNMWIIWVFIPGLTWVAWVQAGMQSKHFQYLIIATGYGIPVIPCILFSHGLFNYLFFSSWIIGIIHSLIVRKEVSLRIKYGAQLTAEVEKKIAAEYGVTNNEHPINTDSKTSVDTQSSKK
jgi:hypothetical protein